MIERRCRLSLEVHRYIELVGPGMTVSPYVHFREFVGEVQHAI